MASTVTLLQGDAVELLPTLDPIPGVIVTDPVWPNAPASFLDAWEVSDADALWRDAMRALPSATHRLVVILRGDSDPRFLRHVPEHLPFFRAITLDYAMPGYIGRKLGGAELAYWFGNVIVSAPGRRVVPGRAPLAQPSDRPPNGHPCSRAQVHMDWLIGWCTDPGDLVCDPFMGSGSTGVACVRHGRDFIGIDRDEHYVALARRRMSETTPPLFSDDCLEGATE